MSDSHLLSVILPVYNSEKYLEECLISLLGQEGVQLEIVAVDDGSTDRSLSILRTFAQRDRRIVVFSITNMGVNNARNYALEHATGEYIVFCDSDDTVPPDSYHLLLRTALKDNYDIVIGSHCICNDDGLKIPVHLHTKCRSRLEDFMQSGTLWERIVRRKFLEENSLRFEEYLGGGDTFFVAMLYLHEPRFTFLADPVYCYWHHTHDATPSIANIRDIAHFSDRLRCARDIIARFPPDLHRETTEYIYLNQTNYFRSVLLRLRSGDELEQGFLLFQAFLDEFDWEQFPGSFEQMIGLSRKELSSMTGLDYLRRIGTEGVLPAKDLVLRQFCSGRLGLRYLAAYGKAWLQFKYRNSVRRFSVCYKS